MLERLNRAWRLFLAAPSSSLTAENFKAALLKLYQSDPDTRDTLDQLGISPKMLQQADFDLREFLVSENTTRALAEAAVSEEGQALVARAADLKPGSEEMRRLYAEIMTRFGSPHIEKLLKSLPR